MNALIQILQQYSVNYSKKNQYKFFNWPSRIKLDAIDQLMRKEDWLNFVKK